MTQTERMIRELLEMFAIGETIRTTPHMIVTRTARGVRIAPRPESRHLFRCKRGYVYPARIWHQLRYMSDQSLEASAILEGGMN